VTLRDAQPNNDGDNSVNLTKKTALYSKITFFANLVRNHCNLCIYQNPMICNGSITLRMFARHIKVNGYLMYFFTNVLNDYIKHIDETKLQINGPKILPKI